MVKVDKNDVGQAIGAAIATHVRVTRNCIPVTKCAAIAVSGVWFRRVRAAYAMSGTQVAYGATTLCAPQYYTARSNARNRVPVPFVPGLRCLVFDFGECVWRNQTQTTAFAVQFVRETRWVVFDSNLQNPPKKPHFWH
eukprot:3333832-Rhodomonas_salina.1